MKTRLSQSHTFPKDFLPTVFMLLFCGVCSSSLANKIVLSGSAQGTSYHITYYDFKNRNFQTQIDSVLDEIDLCLSVYRDDSEISLSNLSMLYKFKSADFYKVLVKSREIFFATDGAFDPTVLPLVEAYGFGKSKKHIPKIENLDSLTDLVGFQFVDFDSIALKKKKKNIRLDFNAIAQGYSVDKISGFLEQNGISVYMVEIGGEIRLKGRKDRAQHWQVGIEQPDGSGRLSAVAYLTDIAMSTSGNYRNFYVKDGKTYNHIINPKTGRTESNSLLSVTVFTHDSSSADAYATAFLVMGTPATIDFLKSRPDLDAYLIFRNENAEISTFSTSGVKPFIKQRVEN